MLKSKDFQFKWQELQQLTSFPLIPYLKFHIWNMSVLEHTEKTKCHDNSVLRESNIHKSHKNTKPSPLLCYTHFEGENHHEAHVIFLYIKQVKAITKYSQGRIKKKKMPNRKQSSFSPCYYSPAINVNKQIFFLPGW